MPIFGQQPELVDGWPYLTRTNYLPCYATPNLFCQARNSKIYFNNSDYKVFTFNLDGSFPMGWPVIFDSMYFRYFTPIYVDFDLDGAKEIVVSGWVSPPNPSIRHSRIYIFNNDGSVRNGFIKTVDKLSSLNVADFDSDGEYEIISFSPSDELIFCWDDEGNLEPGWPAPLPDDVIGHSLFGGGGAVGDLDLDGKLEYVFYGLHHIYAYKHDGIPLDGFPITIHDTSYYYGYWGWPPVLADIDQDGYLEMLASAENDENIPYVVDFIAIYEHTGDLKQNWPIYYSNGYIKHNPIAADINNDGSLEIGFNANLYFRFLDNSGTPLPGWPIRLFTPEGDNVWPYGDLIAVDIDGDEDSEIFSNCNVLYPDSMGQDSTWYYGYSYLFGIDHLGNELSGFPLQTRGFIYGRPAVFSHDITSNLMYLGLYSDIGLCPYNIDTAYIELFVFPDSTGPANQWPMISHDNLMTRNYNFVDNVTAIHDGEEALPKSYVLKQNYPNPFNTRTTIEFALPEAGEVSLTVYDILGMSIVSISKGKCCY